MTNSSYLFFASSQARPMYYREAEDTACLSSKIYSFTALPMGWHYGEGSAPNLGQAATAVQVANLLCMTGAERLNAFPDVDGAVLLNSDIDGTYYEFLCHSNKEIEISSKDDSNEERTVDIHGLQELLGDRPWENSFALYTHATTTRKEATSHHQHSVGQVRTKVSQ